ncbi:MAG: type II/IV secretion system protein, partial [Cyanobacteria bacterium J06636_16]
MTNSSQRRALVLQRSFSPFGNKLIQAGYVDGEQMQQALAESRRSGRALTDVLESLTGQQLSPELLRQYKKQQLFELKILYGVESLDPELDSISNTQMGKLIDTLIPVDICRRHQLVPLSREDEGVPSVLIAMVDPENLEAQDDLNRILRQQELKLRRMVITVEDYQRLMSGYLDERVAREKQRDMESAVDVQGTLEDLDLDAAELEDVTEEEADLNEALQDADAA